MTYLPVHRSVTEPNILMHKGSRLVYRKNQEFEKIIKLINYADLTNRENTRVKIPLGIIVSMHCDCR